MNLNKRLAVLEQRKQQSDMPMKPIVFAVEDCSENPETFEIIGISTERNKGQKLDRLTNETKDELVERWMETYYTPEVRKTGIVPILWYQYNRDPVSASDVKVTNAKVMQ